MLEFVKEGFTPRLAAELPIRRHALHASELAFEIDGSKEIFRAPLATDIVAFLKNHNFRMDGLE